MSDLRMPFGRAAGVTAAAVFMLGSCGGGGPPYQSPLRASLSFATWDSLAIGTCRGVIRNEGPTDARQVFIRVWYATASGETLRVAAPDMNLVPSSTWDMQEGRAKFVVPPQVTGGELRYPRVGALTWDTGGEPAQPRKPQMFVPGSWEWTGPDSARTFVSNSGGWAYHVTLTVENRDGEREIPSVPMTIQYRGSAVFVSVARDSAGIAVVPRFKKLRWEDYGGVPDSVGPP